MINQCNILTYIINYFGKLIQESNVFGGKSLVGQVVVGEMSQTIFTQTFLKTHYVIDKGTLKECV